MQRFKCPSCGTATKETALLAHPPGDAAASRALSKRYCPACGAELKLVMRLRWWHALLVAAPLVVIHFKPHFGSPGLPAWSYAASQIFLLGTFVWALQRSKRLVLAPAGSPRRS